MSGYKIDQYGNAVEDKRCPGDSPRAFWFRDIMRKKEAGQGAETDQETERYFMDNHILDGRLGTLTAEIKVLFCLKEPNCSRENEKKDEARNNRQGTVYYNKLRSLAEKAGGFCLHECAYININKAGGGAKESEASKRGNYDREQIIRLNPQIIICCGKGTYEKVKELFRKDGIIKSCGTYFCYTPRKKRFQACCISTQTGNKLVCYEFYHPAYPMKMEGVSIREVPTGAQNIATQDME